MENLLSLTAWLTVGWIFSLRVCDMTLDTLRVLFVMRNRKAFAWLLGFFQSAIYVVAISSVLQNLDNPLNIVGYAAGFATGNVIGLLIEERLAIGHVQLSIISSSGVPPSPRDCARRDMPSPSSPPGGRTAWSPC